MGHNISKSSMNYKNFTCRGSLELNTLASSSKLLNDKLFNILVAKKVISH